MSMKKEAALQHLKSKELTKEQLEILLVSTLDDGGLQYSQIKQIFDEWEMFVKAAGPQYQEILFKSLIETDH